MMRKLLTFVVMALMAVSASAQLVAEKDWTGATGDLPWIYFESDAQGSAEFVEDGIAITVNKKTGVLWQPQAMILEGFDLAKNGNYTVAIVAKFPCDGQLQINMGDWSNNYQYNFPVKATGDFQEVVCEFPGYGADATGSHVLFHCGDFAGTTIVKKVQVHNENGDNTTLRGKCGQNVNYIYDKSTHKLTISGTGAMADSNWDKAPWSSYANKIQTIEIGSGVTSIGYEAFYGCSGLTSVTIPNSVTSIGSSAFDGCRGLTSVTIPNSIKDIGWESFSGCSALTSVTILGSVYFWSAAFDGCNNLSAVHITDLETFLHNSYDVLDDPPHSLSSNPLYYAHHLYLNGEEIKDLVIPNTISRINEGALLGCSGLTSVTIPNSVTSIGSSAFDGCSGLTSVTIPNGVTSIGDYAFASCSGLTSITIPNSVTSIGTQAFSGCSGLTSVTIPNSVTSIGWSIFSGCNNLKYICLASDKYPSSYTLGNTTCQYIMPQSAFKAGIPQGITNYATYTVAPKYITVKSTTATTATLELTPIDLTGGSTGGATPYEVTMYGLNPGSSVKGSWELETKDRGLASIPTVTTKNLVMNVQPAQPTSKIKARLVATVNEPDDDQHFGFEWLRYDAPSIMTPNKVSAPLYKGQIVGSLNNLDPNVYYKYRPYYKSADGSMFYGEWEAFITGDADVFFEPVTHTKEASEVTGESAQLAGSWIEGTEDTEEKGFEYWPESGANTRATGENTIRVIVDGNQTTATVDGLMAGKVYGYHSYVKTVSGTTYGEDKTFKTPLPGDANDNGAVDAADIVELVNAKAGHPSASFNLSNADANADGSFTEADITATADIIMKQ